ncbi:HGGxSTG domain-containing protein [Thiocapsa sp.]|uniref:HGGxSTG domain-containing protein n=1 Tax=Thiocapsa sp. TaxID=2024551 RepID=UPI003593B507
MGRSYPRARTRSGKPCQSPAVKGKRRCRMHGGAAGSGGQLGALSGRYRHGLYTKEVVVLRRMFREIEQASAELSKLAREKL